MVNDLAEYDGSTYIALASSSNVAPPGSLGTKWALFAEAGSASNHTHDDRYYTKSISDGRFLGKTATAANATKLGGKLASYFAAAANYYNKTTSDGRYLGKTAKAADSDRLDGKDSSAFASAADLAAVANGYDSGNITFTNGSTITISHGLGAMPKRVELSCVCVSNYAFWVAGDEVVLGAGANSVGDQADCGVSLIKTSSIFKLTIGVSGPTAHRIDTHKSHVMAPSNFKLRVRAW